MTDSIGFRIGQQRSLHAGTFQNLDSPPACHDAAIKVPISVNLSAQDLQDPHLVSKVETLLTTWDVDERMLELEVTETAMMNDPERALSTLTSLCNLGIAFSVDDFGIGYSSLAYLTKLPVTVLKIDKVFILDMLSNDDAATIVRSTITLAHDLGLNVVAEGVENEAVLSHLTSNGCDIAQGYYLSRPMPPKDFQEWLKETSWNLP